MSANHPRAESSALFAGEGEMCRRMRVHDWSATPLGPVETWPQCLKTAVRIMLDSRYAMWLGWGPAFTFLYNDAYARMSLGAKHPWALCRPAHEVWAEIWNDIGPRADSVVRTRQATWDERLLLFLERRGFREETYHTFSYSPVPDDADGVGGMLCVVTEDTGRVIGERRLKTLRELAAQTMEQAKSAEDACQAAARTLGANRHDLPFVLLYLLDAAGQTARLAGSTGLGPGAAAAPAVVDLTAPTAGGGWPLQAVLKSGRTEVVTDLASWFDGAPVGVYPEPPHTAAVLPVRKSGQDRLAGFLAAGVSPRRPFDDDYRGFLDLLAGQIASAVANARAYEEERRRAEALAELDRAKTTFFSNVSHEFRTPLTLMLGPVEEMLAHPAGRVAPEDRELLEVVQRNGQRLQKLVNTLLDFSRIEAGRVQASYAPTDLAVLTAELASNFRSACTKAGLELVVDCPPLAEPVYVDRDMWEKIVLNLVSNAFKFTLAGRIEVRLRQTGPVVELAVRDTGAGIPADQLPHLFERFQRVEGVRGRTQEGTGIGLALVRELARLHGGDVRAESQPGAGSTFQVTVPLGTAHLPPDRLRATRTLAPTSLGASPYVEEALRWLPDAEPALEHSFDLPSPAGFPAPPTPSGPRPRIVLADDNADMREYVRRLLAGRYAVLAVADGQAALAAVRQRTPDLILTDVMMPELDGFGLLRELRADPQTQGLPVILLSARAGEEARVEGLQAGADDYVTKPFSARELLARIASALEIARLRREALAAERRFRAVFNQQFQFMAILAPDGTVREANDTCFQATAVPRERVLGKRFWETPWWDRLAAMQEWWRKVIAEVAQGRGPTSGDIAYRLADGSLRDATAILTPLKDETGRITHVIVEGRDVTDRKQAEAALRASEQRWRTMAEALPNLVWTDLPNGECDWLSSQWGKYTGIPESELLGLRWLDRVIHPDDRERTLACWRAACADQGNYDLEYRIRRSDGQYRWFKTRGVPIRDEQGRIVYWFGTCTDIEEHKRMEASLREADRRKDEFLATLAHELRNPLAPIRNAVNVLRMASDDPETLAEVRSMIERQVAQMAHLVDDLLDLSRITRDRIELRKERLDLAAVVHSAVETSRPLIEAARHELTVALPDRPVWIMGDLTRLAQVLANLLNNAAKYTPEGGRIEVSLERQGDVAVVRVRDSGVGIPADMLGHIFEMFAQVNRTLERAQGGLGIGLTLVRRLVEMHGGSVEAASAGPGRGSEFCVRLPVLAETSEVRPEADGVSAAASRRTAPARRRVLVVDDNTDGARSLGMLLRLVGSEVRIAHDGEEAVAAAAAFQPDVVVLDIGMPRLNGYDAARRIRQEAGQRPVTLIALTGWGQEEDRRRSKEAGFDHHLVKPVDFDALEQLLEGLRDGKST